ncbi:MAG: DUF6088 family protein [Tannerellaceae bacterium]|jgi:hypothetical protein|nr:DUF6088 family protein [Tannerellaceae bacterium]
MIQSVHQQILSSINSFEPGTIFFPEQFGSVGSSESIRQVLSRICREGTIIRLSKGVYLFPYVDKELGVLYPSVERVAKAIAKRDKARIQPTGLYALNKLGLSTQVPMKVVFYTDGIPRKITVRKQTIVFMKTAPKKFSFKGDLTPLIVAAMKEIGKDKVTDDVLQIIKKSLKSESKDVLLADAHIAPQWITDILIKLIDN